VHPLNVPFTQAIKTISRWGSGSKDLVAALEGGGKLIVRHENHHLHLKQKRRFNFECSSN
jgi:hypothetical protein